MLPNPKAVLNVEVDKRKMRAGEGRGEGREERQGRGRGGDLFFALRKLSLTTVSP